MEKIRVSIDVTLKQYWIPTLINELGGNEDFWYDNIFKGLEQTFNELREGKHKSLDTKQPDKD